LVQTLPPWRRYYSVGRLGERTIATRYRALCWRVDNLSVPPLVPLPHPPIRVVYYSIPFPARYLPKCVGGLRTGAVERWNRTRDTPATLVGYPDRRFWRTLCELPDHHNFTRTFYPFQQRNYERSYKRRLPTSLPYRTTLWLVTAWTGIVISYQYRQWNQRLFVPGGCCHAFWTVPDLPHLQRSYHR